MFGSALKYFFDSDIGQRFADTGGQNGELDGGYAWEQMMFQVIEHIIGEPVLPLPAQGAGKYFFITVMVYCPYGKEPGEQLAGEHSQHMILEKGNVPEEYGYNEGSDGNQHQHAVGEQGQRCEEAGSTQCMVKAIVHLSQAREKKDKGKGQGREIVVLPGQQAGNDQPGQGNGIFDDHFKRGQMCKVFPLDGPKPSIL